MCSRFKFNNLGLGLGMASKSVVKGLKLKIRKFLGLIFTFLEVTEEKLGIEKGIYRVKWYEMGIITNRKS